MKGYVTRRGLLQASAIAGLGQLPFLRPVSAAEASVPADTVLLRPEIEPLVRLIESTPRESLMEVLGDRIHRGLSYRQLLTALMLAGVTNIEPRPSVGFKFHAVLVVNSAHLASLSSPPEHRWLPLLWALDYFKSAAARDVEERGDWTMRPVAESQLPAPHKARQELVRAMDNWDEEGADAAVAVLARSAGATDVYEALFRYGARDFRSIGHKAIYVANSWRTLQCVGWQHAEPVLRSLVYALLMHEGENPRQRQAEADIPFRENEQRQSSIPETWLHGQPDVGATNQLLQTLRTGSAGDCCDLVVEQLQRGVSVQSIWDAIMVGSSELLMRQPGIVALHAVTTTNALRYAFTTASHNATRQLLLLQNAAFLPLFRAAMEGRGSVDQATIETLTHSDVHQEDTDVSRLFEQLSHDPLQSARATYQWLNRQQSADELIDLARVLVFTKGDDAHDYKFSSAILEDYYHISPGWRNQYLAANMFKLRGTGAPDNPLVQRIRAAV